MKRSAHVGATVALAAAVAPLGIIDPGFLLISGGVFAGILIHPDLDQTSTPYGWIRKHRGLSHWPVIGTLDRLCWFIGPVILFWWLGDYAIDPSACIRVLCGLVCSDILHTILDKLHDKLKGRERKWTLAKTR